MGVARGCDLVINVAGTVSGSAELQRSVNVDGARNVTEAAIAAGVSRLVHVSSAGIYGFRTPGDVDERTPVDPGPLPCGATKAEGEAIVRKVAAAGGLDVSIIRPALVYGPGSAVWFPDRSATLPRRQSSRAPGLAAEGSTRRGHRELRAFPSGAGLAHH